MTTLHIKIYPAVRLGVSPEINSLSTILIAIAAAGLPRIAAEYSKLAHEIGGRFEPTIDKAAAPQCR